jgi:hypothetical protein
MNFAQLQAKQREHFLKTGELDGVFFLTREEVLTLLDSLRDERVFWTMLSPRSFRVAGSTISWE